MTTLNEELITDMGILSNEVYDDQGQKYFEFDAKTKVRINSTIETINGTYTIIDSTDNPNDPNTISSIVGMEALLLKAPDGKFVIAFRGTAGGLDILVDFTIFLTSLVTGTGIAWNAQRSDAEAFVAKMMKDYNISSSNLTLTGHSLGGILAQTIASTTQNLEAYTFNALGTTGLTRFENPNGTKILNLSYTDDGLLNGDPLSNAATFWGNGQIGEVLPMIGADLGLGAHGMGYMNAVIATYNFILESFISVTTYRDVTHAYLENGRLDSFFSNTYEKTNQYLFTDLNIGSGSSLYFNFFNYLTASQIEQQAKSDRAVLFALVRLNGFAVEGNLSNYNSPDLAKYSEQYIKDRSLFLYHMLDPDNSDLGDLFIKDRGYGVSAGSNGWDNPKILFGYDSVNQSYVEELIGGSKADHLFGMGGEDMLVGDAGDDYLEGGDGDDYLFGGTGYDTYIADDGDIIGDDDGKGMVTFEGDILTGGKLVGGDELYAQYEGDGGTYYLLRTNNTLIFQKGNSVLTIEKYDQKINALGITLTEELELTVIGNMANENDTQVIGKVLLTKAYSQDITVNLYTLDDSATSGSDYTGKTNIQVTIKAGETEGEFSVTLLDDQDKEGRETFFAIVDSVKGADNSELTYTLKDIQPFTIEDDEMEYAA